MNYSDEILQNKAYNFVRQLFFNIAVAVCIMLLGVVILSYGFGYKPYKVLSNSENPYFYKGDLVITKAKNDYYVGDIVTFNLGSELVSHRIVAKVTANDGKVVFVIRGDANAHVDNTYEDRANYQYDINLLEGATCTSLGGGNYVCKDKNGNNLQGPVDVVTQDKIVGKVLTHLDRFGTYVDFASAHKILLISLVIAVWCINCVIQTEMEIKKDTRLV